MAATRKAAEKARLATLEKKTETNKKELVALLRKTPIVQIACERLDIGRSTYYQWRAADKIFARAADRALEAGRFFVNDLAESKLMQMIKDDNITAIIFWLKHNNPRYAILNRVIHEHEVVTERPSAEEINVSTDELARIMADKVVSRMKFDNAQEGGLSLRFERLRYCACMKKRKNGLHSTNMTATK